MHTFSPKPRSGVLASVLVLLLSAATIGAEPATTPAPATDPLGSVVLDFDCESFTAAAQQSATVHVTVGGRLVVTVCSNASTGYSWATPTIADPSVLVDVASSNAPPASPVPGAAGTQTFTFDATAAGATTVDFGYEQPWEGGDKGVWTIHLDVVVDAAAGTGLSIDCDTFGSDPEQSASVEVPVDGEVIVTLCSNASTGYSWDVPTIDDPTVVVMTDAIEAAAASPMPGAPGSQTFTFHATKVGSTTVAFSYDQPWENGDKGAWTLTLAIVVG